MARRTITNGYYALRWKVLERDRFTCQYCGQKAPNVKLEVDHITPVEDGGTDEADNLTTSCWACNRGKSGLSIINKRKGVKTARPYTPNIINILSVGGWRKEEILNLFQEQKQMSVDDVAQRLNINTGAARVALWRLKKTGKLINIKRGLYESINR